MRAESVFGNGWITREQLLARAEKLKKSDYGAYLLGLTQDPS